MARANPPSRRAAPIRWPCRRRMIVSRSTRLPSRRGDRNPAHPGRSRMGCRTRPRPGRIRPGRRCDRRNRRAERGCRHRPTEQHRSRLRAAVTTMTSRMMSERAVRASEAAAAASQASAEAAKAAATGQAEAAQESHRRSAFHMGLLRRLRGPDRVRQLPGAGHHSGHPDPDRHRDAAGHRARSAGQHDHQTGDAARVGGGDRLPRSAGRHRRRDLRDHPADRQRGRHVRGVRSQLVTDLQNNESDPGSGHQVRDPQRDPELQHRADAGQRCRQRVC